VFIFKLKQEDKTILFHFLFLVNFITKTQSNSMLLVPINYPLILGIYNFLLGINQPSCNSKISFFQICFFNFYNITL